MNNFIEHTNLRPDASTYDIVQLCQEAEEYNFRAVCVVPSYVWLSATLSLPKEIKIVTVIGFPNGAHRKQNKVAEAQQAYQEGADELDVVMDIGSFKSKEYLRVAIELSAIVQAVKCPIKVIVEECFLTFDELKIVHQIVRDSGASYIKTGTGTQGPATLETVRLWKSLGGLKIKAASGIRTLAQVKTFLDVGANVIGSSNSVEIMKEYYGNKI
jgi:deoxyribose-phosphate aldolase